MLEHQQRAAHRPRSLLPKPALANRATSGTSHTTDATRTTITITEWHNEISAKSAPPTLGGGG